MSILDQITYTPNNLAINKDLRNLMVTHISYLRNHPSTTATEIVRNELVTHQYNLYAYLNKVGIATKLHWVIFLINDIQSPEHLDFDIDVLLVPDITVVEEIVAMHS